MMTLSGRQNFLDPARSDPINTRTRPETSHASSSFSFVTKVSSRNNLWFNVARRFAAFNKGELEDFCDCNSSYRDFLLSRAAQEPFRAFNIRCNVGIRVKSAAGCAHINSLFYTYIRFSRRGSVYPRKQRPWRIFFSRTLAHTSTDIRLFRNFVRLYFRKKNIRSMGPLFRDSDPGHCRISKINRKTRTFAHVLSKRYYFIIFIGKQNISVDFEIFNITFYSFASFFG